MPAARPGRAGRHGDADLPRSYPEELMDAIQVSTLISSVGNQGPELIEPVEDA